MNIEIGKVYDYFDDGKLSETRRGFVKIKEIIPYNEINKNILVEWKHKIKQCGWLYAKATDYFVKGELYMGDEETENVIFVRTIDGGWFSLGWWAGRLDVDGNLLNILKTRSETN